MLKPDEITTDELKGRVELSNSGVAMVLFSAILISVTLVALMVVLINSPAFSFQNDSLEIESNEYVSSQYFVTLLKNEAKNLKQQPEIKKEKKSSQSIPVEKIVAQEPVAEKQSKEKALENSDSLQKPVDKVLEYTPNQFSLEKSLLGKRIPPIYPQRALLLNIEGYVVVEYTIKKDGSVSEVVILESEPESIFDSVVLKAVKQFKYSPIIHDGKVVEVKGIQNRFEFKLEK